jgi:HEPN domain-containing protein
MLECRTYTHALFFMHLVLEKLLKAHWVKNNESNHPPRTHDLVKLFEQTKLIIAEKEQSLLREMNRFQLDGRYPDYKQSLYKTYKEKITYSKFASVNIIRKCLLKELQ